jgi:HSP20 family protein
MHKLNPVAGGITMSTVIRWNPIREMAAMQSAMDRLFDETWRNSTQAQNTIVLDVHENSNAYTVFANIPGVDPEAIDINLHDGVLTISAHVPQAEVEEEARVLLNERTTGQFSRRLTLPREVDADNIDATYDNGVLTLVVPKSPEAQPRQIPVKVAHN